MATIRAYGATVDRQYVLIVHADQPLAAIEVSGLRRSATNDGETYPFYGYAFGFRKDLTGKTMRCRLVDGGRPAAIEVAALTAQADLEEDYPYLNPFGNYCAIYVHTTFANLDFERSEYSSDSDTEAAYYELEGEKTSRKLLYSRYNYNHGAVPAHHGNVKIVVGNGGGRPRPKPKTSTRPKG